MKCSNADHPDIHGHYRQAQVIHRHKINHNHPYHLRHKHILMILQISIITLNIKILYHTNFSVEAEEC